MMQKQSPTSSQLKSSQFLSNGNPRKLLPVFLLLSVTLYCVEYLFGQFGSAVPVVSPPSLLRTSTYSLWGAEHETEP